jgi:tetratricopeptide (TPR) repeat protein/transcriptional regulator with XRE-family HTH domain
LPKVAQQDLDEFGRAVKRARNLKGWTLDQLGGALTPASGKSFLSNVEKGQRSIGPLTVGKLIAALGLPETWIDRFLDADIAPEAEETAQDQQAERLMRMYSRDTTAPESAEGLLIGLAETFSTERFIDHFNAYASLKSALETAAEMKSRGALPQNTDSQLDAVMREVSRLNDDGLFDEAAAALDAEMQRVEADREAIFHQQLNQDRIRNRPADAAKRIVANLKRSAPPGGVFKAVRTQLIAIRELGETRGLRFELNVALHLAKHNHARAKGLQQEPAFSDLANCQFSLGERDIDNRLLDIATKHYTTHLRRFPCRDNPPAWAITQGNLGSALRHLGERNQNPELLKASVSAYQAALKVNIPSATPVLWANLQNGLGVALQSLGELTGNPSVLEGAIAAFQAALTNFAKGVGPMTWEMTQNNLGSAYSRLGSIVRDAAILDQATAAYELSLSKNPRDTAPFHWAVTQWNLADLAIARFELSPNQALLQNARTHVTAAREVFAEGSDYQTARCDDLLSKIAAREA